MERELRLLRAEPEDIAAVMAIERSPGYEAYVGRSSAAEHQSMLGSPQYAYFLGAEPDGAVVGFAILRDIEDAHGNLYLKRIAVAKPGEGIGGLLLRRLIDWAFEQTSAHRFWLDCFSHNIRAQRAYARLGFTRDGVLREAYLAPDGVRHDLTMMALTRPEWAARASKPAALPD